MEISELQQALISLTSRNTSQADIARALEITPQTVSKRIKTNSELTTSEVDKINSYFAVDLFKKKHPKDKTKVDLLEQLQVVFDISNKDIEFVEFILNSKTDRAVLSLYKEAIYGNKDAIEICEKFLKNPRLTDVFLTK